jgi:hypothetical protein
MKKNHSLFLLVLITLASVFSCSKKDSCTKEEVFSNIQVITVDDFKEVSAHPYAAPVFCGSLYYVDSGFACFQIADTVVDICGNDIVEIQFSANFQRTDHTIMVTTDAFSNGLAHVNFMENAKVNNLDMCPFSESYAMNGKNELELYLTVRFVSGGSFALDSARFSNEVRWLGISSYSHKRS